MSVCAAASGVLGEWRRHARPFHDDQLPIRPKLERRRIQSELLAAPPEPLLTLVFPVGKPVLPENRSDLLGRLARERIARKESQDVRLGRQKPPLNLKDESVFAPRAKRSEPEIPVKSGLVGRIDSRRHFQILGLVAEGIGCPSLAIARSLELYFIAVARHDRKEPEIVG